MYRGTHIHPLRAILSQRESEGPERAGAWSGPHSSAQCPPRDDPTLGLPGLCPRLRGERELLGPWTEGLAWVYPEPQLRLGPVSQPRGPLGGCVRQACRCVSLCTRVPVWLYACGCP